MMLNHSHLQTDGRQSENAVRIARGTRRLLRRLGFVTLQELALPSGLRADIVGLGADGEIIIVEIKSSIADFRADQKWEFYSAHCDRFFFAVSTDFPQDLISEPTGLIIADGYGAELIRPAPTHRLPAPTRKAMLMRFGHAAADRLHLLWDQDRDS